MLFRAGKEFGSHLRLLRRYLKPHRWRMIMLTAALFGGVGLQLLSPQILRAVIDGAIAQKDNAFQLRLAALYLLAGCAAQVFSAVNTWLGADIGWRSPIGCVPS